MKPGWKSTEFWLTVAFAVLALVSVLADLIPNPTVAVIALAVVKAGYNIARGLAKMTGYKPPELPS